MMNDYKCNFCRLLRSTERENIDKVIAELEKLGFFDAPASRKDHNSFSGGLVAHSLNVYRVAKDISLAMCNINPDLEVSDDSLIIASLLHDICKVPPISREFTKEWRVSEELQPPPGWSW